MADAPTPRQIAENVIAKTPPATRRDLSVKESKSYAAYGEVVEANHEPLLPWEEFERISAKLRDGRAAPGGRGGRPPSQPVLLSGVMRCAHCGHGIWHRRGKRRRYICGNVRQANGACDAAPFNAQITERAVVDHLDSLFVDLGAWIARVTEERTGQRDAIARQLAELQSRMAALDNDEKLVRRDYMKQLQKENEKAADLATGELDRIAAEWEALDASAQDLEAQLAEWDGSDAADAVLDWWTEFSGAIRGEVVNADSVAEANAALKEKFAAIFVHSPSPNGKSPRLDFILRERPPGSPLVSSRLWADDPDDLPDDGYLIDFIQENQGDDPGQTDRSTLV